MRRVLPALALSLAIHALLWGMDLKWFTAKTPVRPASRAVTLSLRFQAPRPQKSDNLPEKLVSFPVKPEKKQPLEAAASGRKPPVESETAKKKKPLSPRSAKIPAPGPRALPVPEKAREVDPLPDGNRVENTRPYHAASVPVAAEAKTAAPEEDPARQKSAPSYRDNPPPPYPGIAKRKGLQGTVVLDVLVTPQGTVGEIRVFQSSGYAILDQRAEETVKTWVFEPGTISNQPVQMWVRVPIQFQLE
ncbi:MAG: energy transducer TonB [Desulfobacterales bacterium]|nr:energy transducer TonB [Desulfobacterales bacterium]